MVKQPVTLGRNWRLETGNWQPAFPASTSWSHPIKQKLENGSAFFQFPVSIFQSLVLLNAPQIVDEWPSSWL
jgi:hypothetical protein